MPLQATSGAASYDAFGGGVPFEPIYIEQVFQNWLYTGNGTTQTITNGIDLAGKGGLVWIKNRLATESVAWNHILTDTNRGRQNNLFSNLTDAQSSSGSFGITSFNANGFSVDGGGGSSPSSGASNLNFSSAANYASWTFRKQPKFFDVVTYTGNGTSQNIAHSLGSVPGCIIVKDVSNTRAWSVYHTSLGNTQNLILSGTNAAATAADWNNTTPTSTQFTVGTNVRTNASGATYVAYLFAHNAGGFGLTGTDNVISCGSFTQASGGTTVNLGFEPQWVMVKNSSGTGNWFIFDNMRGNSNTLIPNLSNAEGDQGAGSFQYNATGFTMADYITGAVGDSLIYIAIRRGPMRTPTTGTSVFAPIAVNNPNGGDVLTTNFPVDLSLFKIRNSSSFNWVAQDRLRSIPNSGNIGVSLATNTTAAELSANNDIGVVGADSNTRLIVAGGASGYNDAFFMFRRAPGFFDEVCYTGTGVARTVAHNLTVSPELIITKRRNLGGNWNTYSAALGNTGILFLDDTSGNLGPDSSNWNNTSPTSSVFTVGTGAPNLSGGTYVAYLFASCPGVSKVTNFTGTGALQTINCGFTSGARFVLIKRTDSTGDWYVWDSSRGLSSSNDPYLLLNSTAAEVTSTNWVDTTSTGFQVTSASGNNVNINGASYIALAIS